MAHPDIERLRSIKTFPSLVKYLRDELDWPIESDDVEDLTFEYEAEELGIDPRTAAKIQEIKQLRPMDTKQPWGIFFVKFEPKRLPVVVLRKILNQLVIKKRASAGKSTQAAWNLHDLLFISSYGEQEERQITFAHFTQDPAGKDLPTLKVLGWDGRDTALHVNEVVQTLKTNFRWPRTFNVVQVRERWSSAFEYRHREVINTASELAERLAALANRIRGQVLTVMAYETEKGPIRQLHAAFRAALVHDLEPEGFADMYAQTIAYGLLSARIADPTKTTLDDFAAHMRTNPFLRELMETFLRIGGRKGKAGGPGIDFDELGVSEVVTLLDEANMEAVVRDFGDRNPTEDPVIHFYEHFLAAYDKQLKVSRGVFYTPQPVVSYIVRSVHELLQTKFGLEDGLADTTTWGEMLKNHPGLKLPPLTDEPGEKRTISPNEPFVQILDPATGTATFLVEVIEVIHLTMQAKWRKQRLTEAQQLNAWNEYVPKHLLPRLHGYELMMAPYAIAHMKVGLKLAETGYRFGAEERARIFLTNTIERGANHPQLVGFEALAHEADAVNKIKRGKKFTVIIGNPPYSNFSANLSSDARKIINAYKFIDGIQIKERNALQLERNLNDDYIKFFAISEQYLHRQVGIIAFITNNSYLNAKTLRGVRANFLSRFEKIAILDLNGEAGLSGSSCSQDEDENVFDISQGVAISILCQSGITFCKTNKIKHQSITGTRLFKYDILSNNSISQIPNDDFDTVPPLYIFGAGQSAEGWDEFLPIDQMLCVYAEGLKTGFDDCLIGFSESETREKLNELSDPKISEQSLRDKYRIRDKGWAYELLTDRKKLIKTTKESNRIIKFAYRPLDFRYIPWPSKLLKASSYVAGKNLENGKSICLILANQVSGPDFVSHFMVSRMVPDNRIFYSKKGSATYFPLMREDKGSLITTGASCIAPKAASIFSDNLKLAWTENGQGDLKRHFGPESLLYYSYSIFHSNIYRNIYNSVLKSNLPRIPIISNLFLFKSLVDLGKQIVDLHLFESTKLPNQLTNFVGNSNLVIGKISWSENTVWINESKSHGFTGVDEVIWKFNLGGYQICEKWLKDRKGRVLSDDDIKHYHKIVVTLSETIRLMAEIDEVIEAHGGWPGAFVTGA